MVVDNQVGAIDQLLAGRVRCFRLFAMRLLKQWRSPEAPRCAPIALPRLRLMPLVEITMNASSGQSGTLAEFVRIAFVILQIKRRRSPFTHIAA